VEPRLWTIEKTDVSVHVTGSEWNSTPTTEPQSNERNGSDSGGFQMASISSD
jgi:hypothetical protein